MDAVMDRSDTMKQLAMRLIGVSCCHRICQRSPRAAAVQLLHRQIGKRVAACIVASA